MVNRINESVRNRRPSANFISDPAERLLEQLAEKPGNTLIERAAALNPKAREVLMPILARLDTLNPEANPAIMDELNVAITELDRTRRDGIEDDHYGEIRKFADSRYDGAPTKD